MNVPKVEINLPADRRSDWCVKIDGETIKGVRGVEFSADTGGSFPILKLHMLADIVMVGDVEVLVQQTRHVARCTRPHSDEVEQNTGQARLDPPEPVSVDSGGIPKAGILGDINAGVVSGSSTDAHHRRS